MELMSHHDLVMFLLAVAVLLGAARFFGEVARRLGQPSVLGEIAAGILLGPTLLGTLFPSVFNALFPAYGPVAIAIGAFSLIAITLFLLVAGMEVDLSTLWRQGKSATSIAFFGMVIPFGLGYLAVIAMPSLFHFTGHTSLNLYALFFATALSISALPVIAKTLMDLNLYRSDIGMVVIASAMVNDLAGWIIFAMILGLMGSAVVSNGPDISYTIMLTLVFVVFMLTAGRWIINRVLPWINAHTSYPGGILGFSVTLGLLCAAFTEWVGIHAIFGAFILGIALGDSRHLRERTRATIDQFISFIFAPIFFASIGLKVNFIEHFDLLLVLMVLFLGTLGKVGGCLLGARIGNFSRRESWAIGFAMNSRGAMEIILSLLALQVGLIGQPMFVALVILALVTSMTSGALLQFILKRKRPVHFTDFASSHAFLANWQPENREEAILELSHVACETCPNPLDAQRVNRMVWNRECLMSTALGNGVAVPHARIPWLREPLVAIGIVPKGIDFDTPDDMPVHLVILVLTPYDEAGHQLDIMSDIGGLFRDSQLMARILEVENYTQFLMELRLQREATEGSHSPVTAT